MSKGVAFYMDSVTIEIIRGVLDKNPGRVISIPTGASMPAGVMLLLYQKDGESVVLLNKRSNTVQDHKGEISFPGGRKEEADSSLLQTALRELQEEMGINSEDVDVLGELDEVETVSNYVISSFVGLIPEFYKFTPSFSEVEDIIEMPIEELINGGFDRNDTRLVDRIPVKSPCYAYDGHVIFGATARLLSNFVYLMRQVNDKELTWKI